MSDSEDDITALLEPFQYGVLKHFTGGWGEELGRGQSFFLNLNPGLAKCILLVLSAKEKVLIFFKK